MAHLRIGMMTDVPEVYQQIRRWHNRDLAVSDVIVLVFDVLFVLCGSSA